MIRRLSGKSYLTSASGFMSKLRRKLLLGKHGKVLFIRLPVNKNIWSGFLLKKISGIFENNSAR